MLSRRTPQNRRTRLSRHAILSRRALLLAVLAFLGTVGGYMLFLGKRPWRRG